MKSEIKKAIYLILWVIAGVVTGVLLAGVIELKSLYVFGELSPEAVLYGVMIVLGAFFGLFVGPLAWKKIYVEGLRGKKYVVK